jgi:hypothetical protein
MQHLVRIPIDKHVWPIQQHAHGENAHICKVQNDSYRRRFVCKVVLPLEFCENLVWVKMLRVDPIEGSGAIPV